MTDRLLEAPHDLAIEVPSELRREDSLYALLAPVRPFSTVLALLTLASLLVHAAVVTMAVDTSDPAVATAPKEIPIEIVSEPKPAQVAKLEPDRASAKRPDAKPESARKPEPAQTLPPKPVEQAKAEPPKAAPSPPVAPKAPLAPARAEKQNLDALQKELAALKAEQAALNAQSSAHSAPASDTAVEGPLAGSLQAIAMPGASENGDDVVAYQDLVFSQLAKAKGVGEYHGAEGTTGVRFAIDEAGHLVSVDVSVSSGNSQLDAEALAIVRRAAPFPLPPKDSQRTFVANVNFVPPKPKL